jgi:hypothetical protein
MLCVNLRLRRATHPIAWARDAAFAESGHLTINDGAAAERGGTAMRKSVLAALAALLMCDAAMAAEGPGRRLYDRDADCAVFAIAGVAADDAAWDGPCIRGLANGDGTATFFDSEGGSVAISTNWREGAPRDGKGALAWSDGARYQGDLGGGKANGAGVLTDRDGNRFEGFWRDGAMTGHGRIVWRNGDSFEGELVAGKAEGHGVQIWADGHKYDGNWRNDQPDGQGIVTRRDGSSFNATFVAGVMQPATAVATAAPPPPSSPPAPQSAVASAPVSAAPGGTIVLADFAGRTLIGVDRSTVSLAPDGNAMAVTITSPDGEVRRLLLSALGNGMGSIADASAPSEAIGMFRASASGLRAEYADGHVETIAVDGDGLRLTLTGDTGKTYCASWYPQGHSFSDAERKAAVAAYARRIGLSDGGTPASTCATAAPLPVKAAMPVPTLKKRKTGSVAAIAPGTALPPPEDGAFKPSEVHTIDAATPVATLTPAVAPAALQVDETIASNCLKVDSDGAYWGFRNHCGYSVQFSFCLLQGNDTMTACGTGGGIAGSVPANGFGALFSDASLGERGVDHKFRWIGCRGGAGEVVAHLDHADPASGRCVRGGTLARAP